MSDTQCLIDKITSAISFKFKEDTTAPNLTISRLKNGYYCSVIRFTGSFARGKEVVCKVRANNLDDALKAIAKEFLSTANHQKDPLQELSELVKGS